MAAQQFDYRRGYGFSTYATCGYTWRSCERARMNLYEILVAF